MTNHPNRRGKFELAVTQGAGWGSPATLRYRRYHQTFEAAKAYAGELAGRLEDREGSIGRNFIVYGPGCGPNGITV